MSKIVVLVENGMRAGIEVETKFDGSEIKESEISRLLDLENDEYVMVNFLEGGNIVAFDMKSISKETREYLDDAWDEEEDIKEENLEEFGITKYLIVKDVCDQYELEYYGFTVEESLELV